MSSRAGCWAKPRILSDAILAWATLAGPIVTAAPGTERRWCKAIFAAAVVFALPRGRIAQISLAGPKYAGRHPLPRRRVDRATAGRTPRPALARHRLRRPTHLRPSRAESGREDREDPESGKVRSVPLVAELIAPLNALSQRDHFTDDDDLVFCTEVGTHLDGWALRKRYAAALETAGLRPIRFHDLRHCFGSVAVRAFPLSDVQAMLGHAHITTTMRYVHHRPGADDAARLSSAFRGDDVSPLVSARSLSDPA